MRNIITCLAITNVLAPSVMAKDVTLNDATIYASLRPTILISDTLETHGGGSRVGIEGKLPKIKKLDNLGEFRFENDIDINSSEFSTNIRHAYVKHNFAIGANGIAKHFKIGKTDAPSSSFTEETTDIFNSLGNAFGQGLDRVSNMVLFGFRSSQRHEQKKDVLIPAPHKKYSEHDIKGKVAAIFQGESESLKNLNAIDIGLEYQHRYSTITFGATDQRNSGKYNYLGLGFRYFTSDILSLSAKIENTNIDGLSYHLAGERIRNDHTFRFGFAEHDKLNEKSFTLGYSRPISKWAKYSVEIEQGGSEDRVFAFYLELNLKHLLPISKLNEHIKD